MSNQTDYEQKLETIVAIPAEETKVPTIPMANYHQEGDNLYHWCMTDVAELVAVGISEDLINDLAIRVGASREAQSLWTKEYNSRKDAENQWATASPDAFDFRDMLLHTYRYAFRANKDLLSVVDSIAEGATREDMIQDLNDLAVLGKGNLTQLAAVSFDAALLDEAAEKADQMGNLLAAVNGDRESDNEALVLRNKAYTHLKEAMDEIRQAGKYAFWKNKDRLKGYSSAYYRKFN